MTTSITRYAILVAFVTAAIGSSTTPAAAGLPDLSLHRLESSTSLALGDGAPFHSTRNHVFDQRLIDLPGSDGVVAFWTEQLPDGERVSMVAISRDGDSVVKLGEVGNELLLRYAVFDPLTGAPEPAAPLAATDDSRLLIVQFVSQPLDEYRRAVEALGSRIHHYLANSGYIVEMSASTRAEVEALPFVRWVGPYHPAYKLEEMLVEGFEEAATLPASQRYHIQVTDGSFAQKLIVADQIEQLGGGVDSLPSGGSLLDATLTPSQLEEIIHMDEVFFVDRRLPLRFYMDNVRVDGGADHVESVAGFTGKDVRGEVMDGGLLESHQAWQYPPIIHNGNTTSTWHGTQVYGICFGDGTGNASGRGMLPDAQGIFARQSFSDRPGHIGQLVQDPYYAVFQTNSWGNCCTTVYGTRSQEIDEIVMDTDIIILQAQANEGSRFSDVSAWAKNNVSVGGIYHQNSLSRADDAWSHAGSIGPAEDGRVKPDLAYWYDWILTTSQDGGYTPSMGGTSAATPMTAGHFGLMFEMWDAGIFGNPVDPGGSVFDNRPHAATAKALMINSAEPYDFSGAGHDLTRVHQGWGLANVRNLYDRRDGIFVINETDVLANLESTTYELEVEAGTPLFKATMAYLDPAGTTSSSQHRINDLTVVVTSPSEAIYYGNNGLLEDNWSDPGGAPNTIDTVENVWIQNPEAGTWTIEVRADEVNEDAHLETPAVDADYALVVSGVVRPLDGIFADGFESGDTSAWSLTVE